MQKIIITVDGFSSCGKSTLAKQLAAQLGYVFIDSGAMYRAITLYFLREQINWNEDLSVENALKNIELKFHFNVKKGKSDMYLNGENVDDLIRELSVAEKVSEVAAVKAVRDFAVAQQQAMGIDKGIIMDGRDIGTTVFPNAELKIFVTADVAIRAERRYKELIEKNMPASLEDVANNLKMRDDLDTTRAVSPLRKADDAIVLDNSYLTREQQFELVLQWANEKIKQTAV